MPVFRLTLLFAVLGLGLSTGLQAQFVLFPVTETADEPGGVCQGPDGNVWFTVRNQVGRMTPGGEVIRFDLAAANADPGGIVAAPDGNLWFVEKNAGKAGRISPAGSLAEFSIPSAFLAGSIAVGPDGAIWLSDIGGALWRVTLSGAATRYPVPSTSPVGLAAGSDGNLWFTNVSGGRIGRMTLSGSLTLFALPSPSQFGWACERGPDGNIWYTVVGRSFGRVTPSGTITQFSFTSDRGHMATAIAAGPDGNLWMPVDESFTCIPPCVPLPGKDGILRISVDGAQARFELAPDLQITDSSKISVGPGGSLWFTAQHGLVRFFPSELAPPAPEAQNIPVTGVVGGAVLTGLLALAGYRLLRR